MLNTLTRFDKCVLVVCGIIITGSTFYFSYACGAPIWQSALIAFFCGSLTFLVAYKVNSDNRKKSDDDFELTFGHLLVQQLSFKGQMTLIDLLELADTARINVLGEPAFDFYSRPKHWDRLMYAAAISGLTHIVFRKNGCKTPLVLKKDGTEWLPCTDEPFVKPGFYLAAGTH